MKKLTTGEKFILWASRLKKNPYFGQRTIFRITHYPLLSRWIEKYIPEKKDAEYHIEEIFHTFFNNLSIFGNDRKVLDYEQKDLWEIFLNETRKYLLNILPQEMADQVEDDNKRLQQILHEIRYISEETQKRLAPTIQYYNSIEEMINAKTPSYEHYQEAVNELVTCLKKAEKEKAITFFYKLFILKTTSI